MALVRLELLYDTEAKRLTLNGPIDDRIVSYGMLAMAMDLVYDHAKRVGKKELTVEGIEGLIDLEQKFRRGT